MAPRSRRRRSLLASVVSVIALVSTAGCGDDAPARAEAGEVVVVDSAEAAALMDRNPRTVVIDVRTHDEYVERHMVGAQHIDVQDPGLWERRTGTLERDRPTIVYCRSGNRSAHAAQLLVQQGFTEVYDLGGIDDWNEGDLPVDR